MLKSLLVGINGNEWSRTAGVLGVKWARKLGIPVTFMGVLDVENLTGGQAIGIMGRSFKAERDEKVVENWTQRIQEGLDDAARKATEAGVEHKTIFVEGSPSRELGREMQRHDLLIIGKRSEPRSDREPASSETMTDILRVAARPVVVTGDHTPTEGPVMIAYAGSPQASYALGSFVASGLYEDRPVHLVGVDDGDNDVSEALDTAREYLTRHGRDVQVHLLPKGDGIAATLTDFASREAPALLVMGVYGKPRLQELLIGSVSKDMLESAAVPMFLDR